MDYQMTDNRFSWRRVGMVGRFYYPRLKWQLIAYPIASICLTLLISTLIKLELPALATAPFSTALSFIVYLGPLFFTAKAAREVETTLPATAGEKATFMILYSLVVIPLLTWIPQYTVQLLMFGQIIPTDEILKHTMPANANIDTASIMQFAIKSIPANVLIYFAVILTCLYAVVSVKRNRIVMSIVFCIVYQIAVSIVTVIYFIFKIINSGFIQKIAEGKTTTPDAVADETIMLLTEITPGIIWLMGGFSLVSCIVLIYMINRGIKRYQM